MYKTPIILLTFLLTVSIAQQGYNTEPQEIDLGALLSLNGGQSSSGEDSQVALETSAQDINKYLTDIDSKNRIKLIVEDSGTDPAIALQRGDIWGDNLAAVIKDSTETAFPYKPITILTGWLGGSEQFLNAIAPEAAKALGVPVNIESHVGNDGMDAIRAFENVSADGYTLLLILDFDPARYARGNMTANPAEDWIPILIGNIAVTQIYIHSGDPRFSTWDELVAYAKEHPGLKLATLSDPLSLEGLSAANLEEAFGVSFVSVPIDSAPQRNASFLSGETDLLIDQPGDVKQYIDADQYKPVLTLWDERVKGFEDVPTAKEKGADFTPLLRLRGLAAPGETPSGVIEVLQNAFQTAFNSAAYQEFLSENSLDLVPYPDDPVAAIRDQIGLYKQLYGDLNVKIHAWRLLQ